MFAREEDPRPCGSWYWTRGQWHLLLGESDSHYCIPQPEWESLNKHNYDLYFKYWASKKADPFILNSKAQQSNSHHILTAKNKAWKLKNPKVLTCSGDRGLFQTNKSLMRPSKRYVGCDSWGIPPNTISPDIAKPDNIFIWWNRTKETIRFILINYSRGREVEVLFIVKFLKKLYRIK